MECATEVVADPRHRRDDLPSGGRGDGGNHEHHHEEAFSDDAWDSPKQQQQQQQQTPMNRDIINQSSDPDQADALPATPTPIKPQKMQDAKLKRRISQYFNDADQTDDEAQN